MRPGNAPDPKPMTVRTRNTLLITAAATAVFFGLRALPDTACGFMHLHDTVVGETGLEYCDPSEVAMYAETDAIKFPVTAEIVPDEPLVAGKTTRVRLTLRAPNGNALLPHEIALSHTKQVHLMATDPALDAYRHLHPEPEGTAGEWVFDYTPASGGEQVFFIDCIHRLTKRPQLIRVTLPCAGATVPAAPLRTLDATLPDGGHATLSLHPQPAKTGEDIDIRLRFAGRAGAPVTLKPVMAAYAHLVAFDPERKGFAHLHPLQTDRENDPQPELRFRFRTDKPGRYRLWAQFDAGHGETFVPFDVWVR